MADPPDTGDPDPVEDLQDHLDEVSDRSDRMQERLDELGEHIEAARRQAEADHLLPDDDAKRIETPLNDADFEAGG